MAFNGDGLIVGMMWSVAANYLQRLLLLGWVLFALIPFYFILRATGEFGEYPMREGIRGLWLAMGDAWQYGEL